MQRKNFSSFSEIFACFLFPPAATCILYGKLVPKSCSYVKKCCYLWNDIIIYLGDWKPCVDDALCFGHVKYLVWKCPERESFSIQKFLMILTQFCLSGGSLRESKSMLKINSFIASLMRPFQSNLWRSCLKCMKDGHKYIFFRASVFY